MKKRRLAIFCALTAFAACLSAGCSEGADSSSGDTSRTTEPTSSATTTSATTTTPSATATTTTTPAATTTTASTTTAATSQSTEKTVSTTVKEESAPTQTDINSYRAIGENGILVAGMDGHYRGIMFYGGTYGYCDEYVLNVKEFQAALPEVSVYSMVIPTSVDFYNPEEYAGHTSLQKDKIDYIESELSEAGINNIRVYDVLAEHTDEEIYSRTDHHWMPLGGYYAAKTFCDSVKLEISPLKEYNAQTCGGYVGSMYYYSEDINLYNDPEEYTVYYSPNADALTTTYYDDYFANGYESNLFLCDDASYYYLSFLGSDDLIAHIETNVDNNRTLVVIKESYGNALIPFLTEAFENIYVLDLRYCEVNAVDFCRQTGATDLLFANCAYTVAGGNCDYFSYIRTI